MNLRKLKYLAAAGVTALALSACGQGNCPPNGDVANLSLKLTAPNQYPANMAITAYLTITNTSNVKASNLLYSIPAPGDIGNTTGTNITVANGAANPCLNIAAGASCTFPVLITNNPPSHPGSFTVTATPQGVKNSSMAQTLDSAKSSLGLQAGSLTLTANIGLTTVPANSESGANGITFLYNPIISASGENESSLVSIVAVVNSATAGEFNTINLTDCNSGALLNFKPLSGNNGSGYPDFNTTTNSVTTFNLVVPAGVTNYQFCGQTQKNGTLVNQSNIVNPISVASSTSGALAIQPTNFTLHEGVYESQVITLTNIGNGKITQLSLVEPLSPLSKLSTTCGDTLAPNASCQYIVDLGSPPIGFSGQGTFTANYYNGSSNQSGTSQINWIGRDAVAGVSLTSGTNPNFNFTTNTESGTYSSQATLKNTGNVSESNFVFVLPQYFSISAGTTGTPCTVSGSTVTNSLASQSACTITLTYTNSTATDGSISANMNLNYKASIAGVDTPSPTSTIGLTHQTIQATAVLQILTPPNSYVFPSILGNSVENESNTFTVTNTGNGTAYNVGNRSLQAVNGLIIIPSSTPAQDCGTSITQMAPGGTCLIAVKFGPVIAPTTPITLNKTLSLDYQAFNSASTSTMTYLVSGTANAALSANIAITSIVLPGSVGDGESANTQFAIESSLTPQVVTITYTNKGAGVANNFTVSESGLAQGYSVSNNGCNGVNLESNTGSCTLTLSLLRTTPSNPYLNVYDWLLMSWTDLMGNHSLANSSWNPTSGGSFTQAYVTVYSSAYVTAGLYTESMGVTNLLTSTAESSSFYAVFGLSGGYQVANMSYSVTPGTGGTPAMSVDGTNSCTLSSNTSTCSIKLNAGGSESGQTVTYNPTGSAITTSPTSSNIDVYSLSSLLISLSESTFYSGGESSVLTITMTNAPVVPTPITVSYGTSNILTTSGSCSLSSGSNTCTVKLLPFGSNNGTTTITATGGGATSNTLDAVVGFLIYTTESTTTGGLALNTADAIQAADTFCFNNRNTMIGGGVKPSTGQVYALLAASPTRDPTTSWPLKVNKYYVNTSRQLVGQAVNLGVNGVGFNFPLDNVISPSSQAQVWTGLYSDWSVATSENNCNGWTSNAYLDFGNIGIAGYNTNSNTNAIWVGNTSCSFPQHLYCVYGQPS